MTPSGSASEPEDAPLESEDAPGREVSRFRRVLKLSGAGLLAVPWIGVLIGIVVLGVLFNSTSPCHCFMTSSNLLTTAQEFSYVGIAALGGAMVIMTKGIDLSVGSNISLSGLLAAAVMADGHGTALAPASQPYSDASLHAHAPDGRHGCAGSRGDRRNRPARSRSRP